MVWKLPLVVLLLLAPLAHAVDLYVSPAGSDTAAGTRDHPLATLERARDTMRVIRKSGHAGACTIWLAGGTYLRDVTFALSADDSGAADAPVVYRAMPGETPRLQAGRIIAPPDLRPVTDPAILARLDPAARGKIVQLDLKALHIKHAGPFPDTFSDGGGIAQLFCDGVRMPLSRWPHEGYTTIARVIDRGDWSTGPARHGGVFIYGDDRPSRWKVENGVWLDGFWRVPWEPWTIRVQSIDAAKKQITFAQPIGGGIGSKYGGSQGSGKENWYALNLLEEIDQPGGWCIDFKTQTLYFWPPAGSDKPEVYLADLETPMVLMEGASHLTFRGIQLEGGLGDGIDIRSGEGDLVEGCTLCRLGHYGVVIKNGHADGVQSCDLYDLGFGGIAMGGGDRKTLTPADHFAVNNHIHHFGRVKKTYAPGIALGAYDAGEAIGCRVQHNLIHDAPHSAVLYGGNDNVLEFNEVYSIALDSGDVGAFYTWHDWTSRGNVVRYNFVHDCPRANAFYMDDGDSGDTIFSNVVYRCIYGPFIGGGHDNLVRNNLIVDCERGIHIDARGVARGYDANNKGMVQRLTSANYQQPPWSTRYPELATILTSHPELPTGCAIENNILAGCKVGLHLGATEQELKFCTIRDNMEFTKADAGLVDPDHLDFRLKSDSPAFKHLPPFLPIPFEKMGLYVDEDRAMVPVRVATTQPSGGGFDSNVDVQRTNQKEKKEPPTK